MNKNQNQSNNLNTNNKENVVENNYHLEVYGLDDLKTTWELLKAEAKEHWKAVFQFPKGLDNSSWQMAYDAQNEAYWAGVAFNEKLKAHNTGLDDEPMEEIIDLDDLTDFEINVLEAYIYWSEVMNASPLEKMYLELRQKKAYAWSNFIEEVESNWMEFDTFVNKVDKRLEELAKEGKEPTEEQWNKTAQMLSKLQNRVIRFYESKWDGEQKVDYQGYQGFSWTSNRNHITYPLYCLAMKATQEYKDFWASDEGKKLSEIKQMRSLAWQAVMKHGLNSKFKKYNLLVYSVINPYFTYGERDDSFNKPELKKKDKQYDVPEQLWYQITGLPDDNHFVVCSYEKPKNRHQASEDEIREFHNKKMKKEVDLLDQMIQESLEGLSEPSGETMPFFIEEEDFQSQEELFSSNE